MSGDMREVTGTRMELTNLERSPYAISSLFLGDIASDIDVCASAGAAPESVSPARATPRFRKPRRLGGLDDMGESSRHRRLKSMRIWPKRGRAIADGAAPRQASRACRSVDGNRMPLGGGYGS